MLDNLFKKDVKLVVVAKRDDVLLLCRILNENINHCVYSIRGYDAWSVFSIKMTYKAYISMMQRLQSQHRNLKQDDPYDLFNDLVEWN